MQKIQKPLQVTQPVMVDDYQEEICLPAEETGVWPQFLPGAQGGHPQLKQVV
jgi:hypothetical protein